MELLRMLTRFQLTNKIGLKIKLVERMFGKIFLLVISLIPLFYFDYTLIR